MRKPLRPLPELEQAKRLAELGLGADLLPVNLTPQERLAATMADTPTPVVPSPGAGGWVPPGWFPLAAAMFLGVGGALAAALAAPVVTPLALVGAVLAGSVAGLSTFLGLKSAGPRQPPQP